MAVDHLTSGLQAPTDEVAVARPTTIASAIASRPDANLALISVPGEYAASEARRALHAGMHVLLFSNRVSLEEELSLKALADECGLLLMGPDCGTAVIDGAPLGFANELRRGNVGIVGAAGTGIQEVSCQLDAVGIGVSQVIGTGSRDLSDAVNGRTASQAIRLLMEDPGTSVIVVIAKEPGPDAVQRLRSEFAHAPKPLVFAMLGLDQAEPTPSITFVPLLDDVQPSVSRALGRGSPAGDPDRVASAVPTAVTPMTTVRFVIGLFSGGTLCHQAALVLRSEFGLPRLPIFDAGSADDAGDFLKGAGDVVVDLGAARFTAGRPHPMIDPTLRGELIAAAARLPTTGVVLLDVVLGWGAHEDPAGAAAEAVERAVSGSTTGTIRFVASVCGTEADPQCLSRSVKTLESVGIEVYPTAEHAALAAAAAVRDPGSVPVVARQAAPPIAITAHATSPLLRGTPVVICAGLSWFAEQLRRQGTDALAVDWKPPAGGDPERARRLSLIL
jgi:FdrA protein